MADTSSPDLRYRESVEFTIKRKGGDYQVEGRYRVDKTFLTERSVLFDHSSIADAPGAEVSKLKVWCRGRKLGKDHVSVTYLTESDFFFTEDRVHRIAFPSDLQPGDSVAYEYRRQFSDIAYIPIITMPNRNRVERFEIKYKHPDDVQVEFDLCFPLGDLHYRVEKPDRKHTILTFDSIPYVKPIAYYAIGNLRVLGLVKLYRAGELLNPVSNRAFCDWYGAKVDLVPTIGVDVDSLIGRSWWNEMFELDKLKDIYDFVRTSVRYVHVSRPLHRNEPFLPSRILARKYGDCKDRAYLTQALARTEGIEVYYTPLSEDPPSALEGTHASLFNHVICAYESDTGTVFFDPTAKYTPFGLLPEQDVGKEALILDPDDPRRVTITPPTLAAGPPTLDVIVEGRLDSLAGCRATVFLRGVDAVNAIGARDNLTGFDFENALDRMITSRFYKISLDSFVVIDAGPDSLVLEAAADLFDFVVTSPTRKYLPRVPMVTVDSDILDRQEDEFPIHLENRDHLALRVALAAPGHTLSGDSTILYREPTARFSARAQIGEGDSILLSYTYERQMKSLEGDSRAAYLDFCRDYLSEKKNLFILEETPE